MPKITFIDHEGTSRTVDAEVGVSVMKSAVRNNVPGIEAECGGQMSCATCHVQVSRDWMEQVGPPGSSESAMLEFADDVTEYSRLSCQVSVTEDLDGLVVHTPDEQV